jgi:hypothetical protein
MSGSLMMGVAERYRRTGSRTPVGTGGHRPSVLKPHREFLEAVWAAQPYITLEALSRRLAAGRAVKADTSMLTVPGTQYLTANCGWSVGQPGSLPDRRSASREKSPTKSLDPIQKWRASGLHIVSP